MTRARADLILLGISVIWGTAFVAQNLGMQYVGPFTFNAVRFLLGALVILPLALRELRALRARGGHIDSHDVLQWIGLGLLLTAGAATQQIGIVTTSVTNASFFTALYVPLVPVAGWLLYRHAPHWSVWPAALACLFGTYLLGGGEFSLLNTGDLWVILSALFWTGHVLLVGRIADRKGVPVTVALAQFLVCVTLSGAWALYAEAPTLGGIAGGFGAIAYGGILSVGVGYTLQVVAQRHTHAADSAILLSAETLFGALAGALWLGETMTPIRMAGAALIFAAVLAVQLVPLWLETRRAAV